LIAWLTHHLPTADATLTGGAEMTDNQILSQPLTHVDVIHSQQWRRALDYDKVVISGTDLLSYTAMKKLAKKKPVLAIHHQQTRNPARKELMDSASKLICHTPRHLEIELSWTNPAKSTWVLSEHNPDEFIAKPKQNFALWAARMHEQKGPRQAIAWAEEKDIPLMMLTKKPREQVLEAMSRAKHFVFLPQAFDAEPRTIIEAVFSGCEVHTNELAGITSIPGWRDPDVLAPLVTNSTTQLWQEILSD